jgi:hypothetical protein
VEWCRGTISGIFVNEECSLKYRRTRARSFPPAAGESEVTLKKKPSFFKRHRDLMTVIGALIIFYTFMFKEGIRDFHKEKAAELESAGALYSTQSVALLNFTLLMDLSVKADRSEDTTPPAGVFHRVQPRGLKLALYSSHLFVTHAGILSDTIMGLCDKLPHKFAGDLGREAEVLSDRVERLKSEEARLTKVAERPGFDDATNEATLLALTKQRQDAAKTSMDLVTFSGRVWEKFKEMKAHEEHAAEFYGILVYVLYVIGSGLALFSRLDGGGETPVLD